MSEVITVQDLETLKKHEIFEAEVLTGKVGGLVGGAYLATATNPVTGQTQDTLPQILSDLGMQVQTWPSSVGGVLMNAAQIFLNDTPSSLGIGEYYAWGGPFPKTVPAGTDPAVPSSGYILRSNKFLKKMTTEALRRSYTEAGYPLVTGSFEEGGTLSNANQALIFQSDGKGYSWGGAFPKTVPTGSTPSSSGGIGPTAWIDQSNSLISVTIQNVAAIPSLTTLIVGQCVRWLGYYSASDGGSNWGIVKSGAHVADGGSIFSITPTLYVEANLKGKTLNVLKFGAKTDGTNTVAQLQAAVSHALSSEVGTLKFSAGTYTITDTLVVDPSGFGHGLNLIGCGENEVVIRQTGAGKDCLKYSETTLIEDSEISGLTLSCAATAGNVINIGFGLVRCTISPRLIQDNPAKSLIVGNFVGGPLGVFDTVFEKAVWKLAPNSTAYGVDITVDGTIFNENAFKNLVCYNATAKQFFSIKTAGAGAVWLANNHFANINFEVCKGGGIEFQSAKTWSFRNISFWDAGGAYVNHLIHSKDGTSLDSIACLFENVSRNGDSLAVGISDIHMDATNGSGNTYINCTTSADATPRYDLNNSTCQIIGLMNGVINGVNAAVVALGDVTANNLNVSANGKIFSPATGIVKTQVLPNSGTHQLSLKNAGGVELTVATDETGVYPYDDNARSMGKGANRWSVIFAGTGSINTSDGREKTSPIAVTDAVLDAWGDVQLIAYKWLDAIQLKGEDTARWHFGVIAQQVRDAFLDHGLDGTAYGLLCYDEWDAREAVLNEDGNVVVPAIEAGNRWGIRPDQCLFVEAAYQRRRCDRIEGRLTAAGL